MKEKSISSDKETVIGFRRCKASDFTSRDLISNSKLESRLCPKSDEYKDELKVKNRYSAVDRNSFSVEIYVCKPFKNRKCASIKKQKELL